MLFRNHEIMKFDEKEKICFLKICYRVFSSNTWKRLLFWKQEVAMSVLVFCKHFYRYQSESIELTHWLQSAKERLEFWSQQSLTVPQELETVRDHLNSFLVSYSQVQGTIFSLRLQVNSLKIIFQKKNMKKKKYFAEFSFQKLMCLHIHN